MIKRLLLLLLFVAAGHGSFAQIIGGIGAQLFIDSADGNRMPRIMSLVPNSPAYEKLNATDYIIKVNDVSCKGKTIEEVVSLIRGEAGTTVKVTTAATKDGKNSKDFALVRVSIQTGNNADPVAAFNESCENEAMQLKKKGVEIIKTFNSDCGNYFFNFNAEAGTYNIRMYVMADKPQAGSNPPFTATARVFDTDNEKGAVSLSQASSNGSGSHLILQQNGAITFPKEAVGTIGVTMNGEANTCRALFIIVYR